jgi:uncharacterized membrane protein
MYFFDDLLLFFLIGIVVIFIILFVKISNLQSEIEEIKAFMAGKKKSVSSLEREVQSVSKHAEHLTLKQDYPQHESPGYLSDLGQWLKTDWLMKLGALFVLMAIVWFVRYAIVNNWIGEVGRVVMGLTVSVIIIVVGYALLKKRPIPAQVLLVLGTTASLFTIYIARNEYDIFTPFTALSIMSFIVLLIAVVSITHGSLSLAITALLGGVIAPALTNAPPTNLVLLNSYVLLLDLGVFAMMAIRGWRILLPLALIATFAYSQIADLFTGASISEEVGYLFMAVFYGLFFIGTFTAVLTSKKITVTDIVTVLLTVLTGIYWVSEYIPEEWQSIVLAVTVVIAAIATVIAMRLGAPKGLVYLNGLSAIALLGTATAFELDGEALTIALALEITAVIAIIRYVLVDVKAVFATNLLLLIPAVLSIESFFHWPKDVLFNEKFFVLFVVSFLILAIATMVHSLLGHKDGEDHKEMIGTICGLDFVGCGVFFVMLIWRSLETIISTESAAHGTALVIYTVIALVLFFIGLTKEIRGIKLAGLVVLVGVILRLIFVEVWGMSLSARTITFVVIGILLITTAFFQKRNAILK